MILFFSVVGIAFVVSVIYLALGNVAPETYWGRKTPLPPTRETTTTPRTSHKYVLELNQGQKIANRIFYYQGRQDDRIAFKVIIPEIDRQYAYPYSVPIAEAKAGVQMAGIRFRLTRVGPEFIRIRVLP